MARAQSTPLRTALSRMFPTALLKRLALSTGTVRRRRRVDPVQLFWVVVLTLGSGRSRTFADLRRSYERVTGTQLSASSFYNRFTPAFTRFLKEVLESRVGEASSPEREDRSRLGGNPGCPLRRLYSHPAPRRSGLLLAGLPDESHLGGREDAHGPQCPGPGTAPDEDHLRAGARRPGSAGRPVVKGRLLLFDLGYFRYALFAAIHQQGGFFLTRLKDNANPTLRCLHRRYRGPSAWRSRDWDCARSVPGFAARSSMPRRRSAFSAEATLANAGRQRSVSGSSAFGMRRARSIIGTSPICRSISSKRKTSASSMPRAGPSNCYSGN